MPDGPTLQRLWQPGTAASIQKARCHIAVILRHRASIARNACIRWRDR